VVNVNKAVIIAAFVAAAAGVKRVVMQYGAPSRFISQ